jgi:hypothetical protein
MAAQTLSIGQAGYSLLDVAPTTDGTTVSVGQRGTTSSRIFDVRSNQGPVIENLGIGANYNGTNYDAVQTSTANVYNSSSGLQVNLGDGGDSLNLFANADGASVELDASLDSPKGGNDLLNAQRSFTNSSLSAGFVSEARRIFPQS